MNTVLETIRFDVTKNTHAGVAHINHANSDFGELDRIFQLKPGGELSQ